MLKISLKAFLQTLPIIPVKNNPPFLFPSLNYCPLKERLAENVLFCFLYFEFKVERKKKFFMYWSRIRVSHFPFKNKKSWGTPAGSVSGASNSSSWGSEFEPHNRYRDNLRI